MHLSIYGTTPCIGYDVKKIVAAILQAHAGDDAGIGMIDYKLQNGALVESPHTVNVNTVYRITPQSQHIPSFGNPVAIVRFHGLNEEIRYTQNFEPQHDWGHVYVDVRNFTKLNRDGTVSITSHLDYNTAILRGMLTRYWISPEAMNLQSLGNFPMTVFGRWISDQITRRLALTPEVQVKVTVLAAYFYGCQFLSNGSIHESDKLRIAGQISRAFHVPVDTVMQIVDKENRLDTVVDFVNSLVHNTDTVRFESFNVALLYSILGGSWFGYNKVEYVSVALEHPPTFLTLLYFATREQGYRKTVLGQMAKDCIKADNDKQFTRGIEHILN